MNENNRKNLDPLSVYFHETNTRKRHNNSLLFVNFVTVDYYLWFQNILIFHFRIPVSILSSFRPLAGFDHGFPLSLANISAMINKRYLLGENFREGLRVVHGFLRPDLTRPGKKLTRPALADKKSDPTRGPILPPYAHSLIELNYLLII